MVDIHGGVEVSECLAILTNNDCPRQSERYTESIIRNKITELLNEIIEIGNICYHKPEKVSGTFACHYLVYFVVSKDSTYFFPQFLVICT